MSNQKRLFFSEKELFEMPMEEFIKIKEELSKLSEEELKTLSFLERIRLIRKNQRREKNIRNLNKRRCEECGESMDKELMKSHLEFDCRGRYDSDS